MDTYTVTVWEDGYSVYSAILPNCTDLAHADRIAKGITQDIHKRRPLHRHFHSLERALR